MTLQEAMAQYLTRLDALKQTRRGLDLDALKQTQRDLDARAVNTGP
jgi:hypothetical protein